MNVHKLAWLPDGWHYGSTEHIDSDDCMGNPFRCCRVTAVLWSGGQRVRFIMGTGNTAEEALRACQQNVEKVT